MCPSALSGPCPGKVTPFPPPRRRQHRRHPSTNLDPDPSETQILMVSGLPLMGQAALLSAAFPGPDLG